MNWIHRLTISQRFNVLIAFVVVAALVPSYFFVQLQRTAIQTTADEISGIPEARMAITAIEGIAASSANPSLVDGALTALDRLSAHARAQRPDLAALVDGWVAGAREVAKAAGQASIEEAKKSGFGVRDALLDASTLSLDPEAHTYNLMVFATAHVPGLAIQLHELEALARKFERQNVVSAEERFAAMALVSQMRDQADSVAGQGAKVQTLVGSAASGIAAKASQAQELINLILPAFAKAIAGEVADTTLLREALVPVSQVRGVVQELDDESWSVLEDLLGQRQSSLQTTLAEVVLVVVLVLVASAAMALLGGRSIRRQLGAEPQEVLQALEQVAKGNLASDIQALRPPEGSILAGVDLMQKTLAGMVGRLSDSAAKLAEATAQLAAGQSDLSSRTERQASALEQTSASTEQLLATIRQNLDQVDFADTQGGQAKQSVNEGSKEVESIVQTMESISEASRRVMDITGAIDSIAFQTNILALNAAVEAARAGEQGRGFAVVASEVRALAQRAAVSAKEIKSLIDASIQTVDRGAELVGHTGETMAKVVDQVEVVGRCMSEIRTAATEQSEGIQQVNSAVTEMDQLTQQNAAMVEEMAATAGALAEEAQALREIVAYFKLSNARALAGA